MNLSETSKKHYVAIIGGSISGSEAAILLVEKGFNVVVFEMNNLPYGKIEDGLPKWHINLRNRQMNEIDAKLQHPNILFVPKTKIGVDIDFLDLKEKWGFSAIIIANGSWKDRKLPITLIEKFKDKELIYQNSLINWFNHKHEQNYKGHNYFIRGNVVVIGGGLASLDVMKIVMIELVKKQLYLKKGIYVDVFTLEKKGVSEILNKCNTSLSELGVEPAKLIYRRTAKEMPLKGPKDERAESIEVARNISEKLLNKYVDKYMFEFIPLSMPINFVEEGEKLKKVVFQKLSLSEGKLKAVEGETTQIEVDVLISSIGSIPEDIKGLNYEYSLLKMKNDSDFQVWGFENVFAVGNAVTGKGNIQESKKHGKQITKIILDDYLTDDLLEGWLMNQNSQIKSKTRDQINEIYTEVAQLKIQPKVKYIEIVKKVESIYKRIGFVDYEKWIKNNLPIRLEDIIKNKANSKCI
jgi:ferredoxin--NADP+ reductase